MPFFSVLKFHASPPETRLRPRMKRRASRELARLATDTSKPYFAEPTGPRQHRGSNPVISGLAKVPAPAITSAAAPTAASAPKLPLAPRSAPSAPSVAVPTGVSASKHLRAPRASPAPLPTKATPATEKTSRAAHELLRLATDTSKPYFAEPTGPRVRKLLTSPAPVREKTAAPTPVPLPTTVVAAATKSTSVLSKAKTDALIGATSTAVMPLPPPISSGKTAKVSIARATAPTAAGSASPAVAAAVKTWGPRPPIARLDVGSRYSEAATHVGTVFLAGQVPETTGGKDIKVQTAEVLHLVDKHLAAAGTDKTRIIMATCYLSNITSDLAGFNAAWDAWVPLGHAPPRATVGVVALADPAWRVEVVVVAAK
jgi:enamine deaminase RidA (YjgF/YER057c/UK114 family)